MNGEPMSDDLLTRRMVNHRVARECGHCKHLGDMVPHECWTWLCNWPLTIGEKPFKTSDNYTCDKFEAKG